MFFGWYLEDLYFYVNLVNFINFENFIIVFFVIYVILNYICNIMDLVFNMVKILNLVFIGIGDVVVVVCMYI